jgi:NTE family protein
VDDIHDRRNELAGNLSLEQELRFVEKINELLERGLLVRSPYRPIAVHRIALETELGYASKFDRSESLIQGLMAQGRAQARQFLADRMAPAPRPSGNRQASRKGGRSPSRGSAH